jgi:hypothetical protein
LLGEVISKGNNNVSDNSIDKVDKQALYCVVGLPSHAFSVYQGKEEEARLVKQKQDLGEEGLRLKEKKLKDAEEKYVAYFLVSLFFFYFEEIKNIRSELISMSG